MLTWLLIVLIQALDGHIRKQLSSLTPSSLSREHVINYLTDTEYEPIAPSVGTALLESFRFARFAWGVYISDHVLKDPQILGRVQRLRVLQQEYRPARDLMVCEVAMMERSMTILSDPIDRYILGCCLFVLYSRSRWSDVKHLHVMSRNT